MLFDVVKGQGERWPQEAGWGTRSGQTQVEKSRAVVRLVATSRARFDDIEEN